MKRIIRYVPNTLTLMRLAAVPVFAWLMLQGRLTAAMWLFLVAEATDLLDGFIARRFNVMTVFGRIADPAADKLMAAYSLVSACLEWHHPSHHSLAVLHQGAFHAGGGDLRYPQQNGHFGALVR